MTIDELQNIVIKLSNSNYVRWWVHWNYPQEKPWLMAMSMYDHQLRPVQYIDGIKELGFEKRNQNGHFYYIIERTYESKKSNFWISWEHYNNSSSFELEWPWWISGESTSYHTICAAIKARNEREAKDIVITSYVGEHNIRFRFCDVRENSWSPFSGRFPKANWMKW